MILPDVNCLVYAFVADLPEHEAHSSWLRRTLQGTEEFAVIDVVLAGFVRIATNPRIWPRPATTALALDFVEALTAAPVTRWLPSSASVWARFDAVARSDSGVRGNLVPDAYLAAFALSHGASIATADRGYARFAGLRHFDPAG